VLSASLLFRSHPVVLDCYLLSLFGPEWYGWDLDSVLMALNRIGLPGNTEDRISLTNKLGAISAFHSNDGYFADWRTFSFITRGWFGFPPIVEAIEAVPVNNIAFSLLAAKMLDTDGEISDEVKRFIVACLRNENFSVVPKAIAELYEDIQDLLIQSFPEAEERFHEVSEALASLNGKTASVFGEEPSAIEMEVIKHLILAEWLRYNSSPEVLLEQAKSDEKTYDFVRKLLWQ
jgi:hypothetical protein